MCCLHQLTALHKCQYCFRLLTSCDHTESLRRLCRSVLPLLLHQTTVSHCQRRSHIIPPLGCKSGRSCLTERRTLTHIIKFSKHAALLPVGHLSHMTHKPRQHELPQASIPVVGWKRLKERGCRRDLRVILQVNPDTSVDQTQKQQEQAHQYAVPPHPSLTAQLQHYTHAVCLHCLV